MKQIVGAVLACAVTLLGGAPASATVLYSEFGTSLGPYISDDLPGHGVYRLEFVSSAPVEFEFVGGYTDHWDIFIAPPPKPHSQYLDGDDYSFELVESGVATTAKFRFEVPPTEYTFFTASSSAYGVPDGTELYHEQRYEGPYYRFLAFSPSDEEFIYYFQISAVPEPATWALFILGFGFAGTALRRERRGYRMASR